MRVGRARLAGDHKGLPYESCPIRPVIYLLLAVSLARDLPFSWFGAPRKAVAGSQTGVDSSPSYVGQNLGTQSSYRSGSSQNAATFWPFSRAPLRV